jgi:hypothetical protein
MRLCSTALLVASVVCQCSKMTVRKDVRDLSAAEWNVYTSTILTSLDTTSDWVDAADHHVQLTLILGQYVYENT